jgi:hypothetical protein
MATVAQLRAAFPEFADVTAYPSTMLEFWLAVATKMLNAERWDDMLDHGQMLFTAHHVVLQKRDVDGSAGGGSPGAIQGAVASKSVDKVAVSYASESATYQDAGFWNLTTYGLQYWNLVRMFGAGGVQFH